MSASRRTLPVIIAAGSLVAGTLAAAGIAPAANASASGPTPGWKKAMATGTFSGKGSGLAVKPRALTRNQQVRVVVELNGPTVEEKAAEARARGERVTKVTKQRDRAIVRGGQDSAVRGLEGAGAKVDRRYTDVVNGVSATVAESQIDALSVVPGVVSVERVATYQRDNGRSNNYTGAAATWASLGATGVGVKVAIIDTGVDYGHADFGGPGTKEYFDSNDSTIIEGSHPFPTPKVVAGYDFVGDAYNADSPATAIPAPDPDPLDCRETDGGGHGTHVGGTAAGFGVNQDHSTYTGPYTQADVNAANLLIAPGSAPQALVLGYRVFGCEGSTDDTVLVAALDRAVADGAQVINMSLGSSFGRTSKMMVKAVSNAVKNGAPVVASAGNSGTSPYLVGSPSSVPAALSVAAADVILDFPGATLSNDSSTVTVQVSNGVSPLPASLPVYVISDGNGGIGSGCLAADYPPAEVAGKLVVAKRGGDCARVDRATFAEAAGAAGALLVNNKAGLPPYEGTIPDVTIPFFGALESDGATLVGLNGQTVTIAATVVPNPGYQAPASFTSNGPRSGDAGAKPEVIAPGVSLVSAQSGSGWDSITFSGTSMASPHTAGIVALVRGARPELTALQAKLAVANTASHDPAVSTADVLRGGNGMVQPLAAIGAKVLLQANREGDAGLSFGVREGDELDAKERIQVINTGSTTATITFATDADPGLDLSVSPSTFTAKPGTSTVEVRVRISRSVVSSIESWPWDNPLPAFTGHIVATVPGASTVSMPVQVVQHRRSAIEADFKAGKASPDTRKRDEGALVLKNKGINYGTAEVFEWLYRDGENRKAGFDTRALGAEALSAAPGDPLIVLALNAHNRFSSPAEFEYDIYVDTTGDRTPEYVVIGADYGALTTGYFDGTLGSFVYNLTTDDLTGVPAYAPFDGSTVELPLMASDLGLSGANPVMRIVGIETTPITDYGKVDSDWKVNATFNPYDPQRTYGDYVELWGGERASIPVTSRKPARGERKSLGWMVATLENRAGDRQALLVEGR